SPEPGGYFAAMIKGKKYSSKELYIIDPNGINLYNGGVNDRFQQYVNVAPEEVAFLTFDSMKDVVWAAFHFSDEYAAHKNTGAELGGGIDIQKQKLVAQIEKSGKLDGDATTTLAAQRDGTRVVALDLFATLRVQKITDEAGAPLSFIQEDKLEDPNLFVILPRALKAGEQFTLRTIYSGKDAVLNSGGETYFPVARDNWFPTNAAVPFGDYADYEMQFRIPKGLTMVATGKRLSETTEGGWNVSTWASEAPQATAGFNFGRFKEKDVRIEKPAMTVQSFANEALPDVFQNIQNAVDSPLPGARPMATAALGTLSTVELMEKPLAEAELAIRIYSQYFGALNHDHVAMTPQATCSFGQSWPYLVYLPICAYLDDTQRHQLVGESLRQQFWKTVGPHEVAHQWWGHTVGFDSYRDQWMSEGFAEFAASLFVQQVYAKDPKMYLDYWKFRREFLTDKNNMGWRAIDAGPVTLGYRLANQKFGNVTFDLIYPKGAYILHMLRQMMSDQKTGDRAFQAMMRDFTQTYTDRVATTEDFKAIVEKHMLPGMDVDGNHRMDWFFNEYVYGTALPSYSFDSSFDNQNGTTVLKLKLTQANVTPEFKMLVPIYVEMADGRVFRLGTAKMIGNQTMEQSVPLGQLKQAPKRAMANYYYDVLATDAR
ncbi:MAG TPA: M1 family aminopeptidase, partial [Terriglobales bacterium]|nr:M1 family aminopeptidase [Terriglobales bacterium]